MRQLFLYTALTFALAGCDDSAKTFGRSFDDCILKNARTGGDQESRQEARSICQRRFEVTAKGNDHIEIISTGYQLAHQQESEALGLKLPAHDFVKFWVHNPFDDVTITRIVVAADFYDKPVLSNGTRDPEAKTTELTWELDVNMTPDQIEELTVGFDGSKAPSPYFTFSVKTKRYISLK